MEAAIRSWGTWPQLPWLGPGTSRVMKVASMDSWTLDPGGSGHKTGSPHPTQLPHFLLFLPTPTLSSALSHYIIFQYPKSYKVYMNITYKDAASFVGTWKEGWLSKAEEAAASTSYEKGPRRRGGQRWGLGPRAVAGDVGTPSECHSLRLN